MLQTRQQQIIYSFLIIAAFIPWLILHLDASMQADAIWLSYSAEQFLAGRALSEYYFDTNPPMCFLVYIPVIMLKSLGFSLWNSHFIYTFTLNIFSIAAVALFLRRWDITQPFRIICVGAYALGCTILVSTEYGQKDHLIGLALLPFVLAQLSLGKTSTKSQKYFAVFTLILLTPFILIKPHYGLIPCVAIAYRFHQSRTISAVFREDFFILAIGVLAYAAIIFIYFPDFIDVVLPISLSLYVASAGAAYKHQATLMSLFFAGLLLAFTLLSDKARREEKELCCILAVMAGLCVIPYWVQQKGFALHYLPVIIMVSVTTFSVAWLYIRNMPIFKQKLGLYAFILLIVIAGVFYQPPEERTKDYFIGSALLSDFEINKGEAFFIENNSTNVSQTLAAYNGLTHASRFSANWFTFSDIWLLPEQERSALFQQLGNYIAADIQRYKPETMVFIDDERFPSYLNSFAKHDGFQQQMSLYTAASEYKSDKILHYTVKENEEKLGEIRYTIYKRKDDAP